MKKLSFYFLASIIVASLAACAGDGSCSMEGQWKVKSADVTSEKLDKSVVSIAKDMMMTTTYNFTADSVTINSGGPSGQFRGTYAVDEAGMTLSWNTTSVSTGNPYTDNMKIVNCGGKEVTVFKRNPADTTQAALTVSTLVLERVN